MEIEYIDALVKRFLHLVEKIGILKLIRKIVSKTKHGLFMKKSIENGQGMPLRKNGNILNASLILNG